MRPHGPLLLKALLLSLLIHWLVGAALDRPLRTPLKAPVPYVLQIQIIAPSQGLELAKVTKQNISHGQPIAHAIAPDAAPIAKLPLGLSPYREARELDLRPEIREDIPINPPELRAESVGGRLILKLWISANGDVDAVAVEQSSLPALFENNASNAFRAAKFKPGEKDGVAVGAIMRVELNYLPLLKPGSAQAINLPIPE